MKDKTGNIIGNAIAQHRKKRELTVEMLRKLVEKELGEPNKEYSKKSISRQYIYQIEKGLYDNPHSDILKAIYTVLSPDDLYERRDFAIKLGIDIETITGKPKLSVENLDDWIKNAAKDKDIEKPVDLWVISNLPIEYMDKFSHDEVFKQTIKEKNLRVIYWMPTEYIVRFWDMLSIYKRKAKDLNIEDIDTSIKNIACIKCPSELTFFSFAIGNPLCISNTFENNRKDNGNTNSKFTEPQGFAAQSVSHLPRKTAALYIYIGDDLISETSYPLSVDHTTYILSRLRPIYEIVINDPGNEYQGYRLVYPNTLYKKP